MFPRRYIQVGLAALIFASMLTCMLILVSASSIGSNAFIDAGCFADDYGLNCSSLGIDQQFGCMQITNASSALENLSPRQPVVECLFLSADYDLQSEEGIVREGCMMPAYRRYIVKQGEEFRVISSREEFRSMFAPVDTKEEALGFAVALTSSLPRYDTSVPEGYFPVKSFIKPTYAEEAEGGFIVHLFDSEFCGCGSHPYYAIEYLVTKEGNVTELSREKVFDSSYSICMD